MEKNYELIKLNNEPYDFLVIATSSNSPLGYLDVIASEFTSENVKVLFDLTLINGNNSNRYLEGLYVKNSFVMNSFSKINDVDSKIKEISYDFFERNEEIVRSSVIPNTLKFLLLEKMI